MRAGTTLWAGLLFISLGFISTTGGAAITADQVVDYSAGTVKNSYWGDPYTVPSAALGLPDFTQNVPDKFDANGNQIAFADNSAITPFNASFNPQNVVAISNGGSLTLHLGSPVVIGPGAALGVHAAVGLNDASYPNGQNHDPAQTYTDARQADLLISADGMHWTDLGTHTFDVPTNIYTDISDPYGGHPGAVLADFSKPFTGNLHSFDGENWSQTLATLNGSAGGTWIDLSSVALPDVNYVRFSTTTGQTMYIDSVIGDSAVPEPGTAGILVVALASLGRRRA
jgi:hypothetical protein